MYVVLCFFTFIITSYIISFLGIKHWFCLRLISSYVISYELFLLDRNTPILHWLFKLGYWFQKNLVTLEPTDLQLAQAIEAFKMLVEVENGEIPDAELKKLLQDGKQRNLLNKIF